MTTPLSPLDASSCVPGDPLDTSHVDVVGPRTAASAFDVDDLLAASATYAVAAMDAVGEGAPESRTIDRQHLLAWCTTTVEVDGAAVPAWADLSGVYVTRDDRRIQVHCNFDHHARGVVEALQCEPTREAVTAAMAERDAFELEAVLIDAGMIGAVVRTLNEWDAHPHAAATRHLPLASVDRIGDAAPSPSPTPSPAGAADGPLAAMRVADCSRVLAGPVAGQMLASFGADVLRVSAEHLPSVPIGVIATGFGKRNTNVDLRTSDGLATMRALLADADVWIDAYRPGAFAEYDLTPELVAQLRPGIVVVQVSAFDWVGPWAGRRGFDSIVQSTTGVRAAGGDAALGGSGEPVGLPVQALDYATGFLAAGLAAQLVRHQRQVGGSWCARTSLLRIRNWLVGSGGPTPFSPAPVEVDPGLLAGIDSDFGHVTTVRPFAGEWRSAPALLGSAPASFSART